MQNEDKMMVVGFVMILSLVIYVVFADFTTKQLPIIENQTIQMKNDFVVSSNETNIQEVKKEDNTIIQVEKTTQYTPPQPQIQKENTPLNSIEEKMEKIVISKQQEEKVPTIRVSNEIKFVDKLIVKEETPNEISISRNRDSGYNVKLISNKTLEYEKEPDIIQYVSMSGVINTNKNEQSAFTLSVDNNYKNDINVDFKIEITPPDGEKIYTCDAYFIKDLNTKYSYELTINLNENSATCYISSQEALPSFGEDLMRKLSLE